MKAEIIEFIKKNRVSSTEIADVLGKSGAIEGVKALNQKKFKVGNVFWVYAYGETNWDMHEQIMNAKEGDIVFIESFECKDRAIFGDIVSKYLLLYKGVEAIVVKGNIRDVHRLIKEEWPIWFENTTPIGCFNKKLEKTLDENIQNERRTKYDGAIAVCDDTGVVIIAKEYHNKEFLRKIELIEEQEDIWYECIDRKKWSTYETICLKRYLKNEE